MKLDEALRGLLGHWRKGDVFHLVLSGVDFWYAMPGRYALEVEESGDTLPKCFGYVEDAIRAFCEMVEEQKERSEP